MNTQDFKKREEYDFLIEFKNTVTFNFEITEKDRESPDFVIRYKNQNIGVELTKYFKDNENNYGSRIKSIEGYKDRIINKALDNYIKTSNPPLRVYINYSPGLNFKEIKRDVISNLLCNCLIEMKANLWERIDLLKIDNSKDLSRYFSSVYALRLPDKCENYWTSINFGFVNGISEKVIITRIREKEKKLEQYKKVTSRNWLIIICDGRNPSSMVSVSDCINFKIKSMFEKVFFLTYPETCVFELQ